MAIPVSEIMIALYKLINVKMYTFLALHSRWVDGCSSWVGTVERIHVFTFTQSWVKGQPSNLYIRQGETLDLSDRTVFDNKKIGEFMAKTLLSEYCSSFVI